MAVLGRKPTVPSLLEQAQNPQYRQPTLSPYQQYQKEKLHSQAIQSALSQTHQQAQQKYKQPTTSPEEDPEAQAKLSQLSSPVAEQVSALTETVTGKPWSYDLNADMLYQQYRDQYMQGGRQAMIDTTGQVAQALTGGYGSSYGTTAGNQAYQQYLTQLNSVIPSLYDRAYQRYTGDRDYDFQQQQFAYQKEQSERQYAFQLATAMMQIGKQPSIELLEAAGIDPADAQAMVEYYAAKLNPPTGTGTGSGDGSGKKTETPTKKKSLRTGKNPDNPVNIWEGLPTGKTSTPTITTTTAKPLTPFRRKITR